MQAVTLQKAISILQDAARGFKRNKEILPILEAYGRFLAQKYFAKKRFQVLIMQQWMDMQ